MIGSDTVERFGLRPRRRPPDEDEGWLIAIATTRDGTASRLLVLDATDVRPVATIELPRGVPSGYHGTWIPDG